MINSDPVNVPFAAKAVGDEVAISGEWGVGLSMTPEAAIDSANALVAAAQEALRNRRGAGAPE